MLNPCSYMLSATPHSQFLWAPRRTPCIGWQQDFSSLQIALTAAFFKVDHVPNVDSITFVSVECIVSRYPLLNSSDVLIIICCKIEFSLTACCNVRFDGKAAAIARITDISR